MEQKDLQEFLYFFTRNKSLTRRQLHKRDQLLARDYMVSSESRPSIDESGLVDMGQCLLHDTTTIVDFLHQFTESDAKALKYTTHIWDKNVNGDYDFANFREFKNAYKEILEKREPTLRRIQPLCNHLWQIIMNFLINDEPNYPWSEFKLKIGYNKYLEKWMNENPGKQPFAMPLRELPSNLQHNEIVNGRYLVNFGNVVDVFKKCIEFRDNDLFYDVRDIFKSSDHIIDEEQLESLRGISFYTDTERVKDAMKIIAGNMRPEYPSIIIRVYHHHDNIQISITQVGSFSDKDVLDPKLVGVSGVGQLCEIRNCLKNLCDFSVESRFRVNNELKHCRINYLSSVEKEFLDVINSDECLGFTYILTFYNYIKK